MSAVLIVAYHFAPENTSGTHRPLHFARALLDAGWDVHVLTVAREAIADVDPTLERVFPHPERVHRVGKRATLGDRYLAMKRALRGGGAPQAGAAGAAGGATAAAVHDAPRLSLRERLALWEAFPDAHKGWRANAVAEGVRLGRRVRFDAVFASGPPWTALRVGAAIARRLDVPFVADFRDPWTARLGTYHASDDPGLRRRAEREEERIVRQARLLLFNSPALAAAADRAYPRPDHPPRLTIVNGSDAPRRETPETIPAAEPLVIRHFGSLYRGRSIAPLLGALGTLIGEGTLAADEVRVELVGRSEETIAAPPVAVRETATVPHAEALRLMREPSLLLLVQPPAFARQIPTKLFEYLCAGNPLLVQAPAESAAWAVARDYPFAHLVDAGDPAGAAAALREVVRRWRAGELRMERTVEATAALTKRAVGEQFVAALARLVSGAAQARP
jgi:hypothetical protein